MAAITGVGGGVARWRGAGQPASREHITQPRGGSTAGVRAQPPSRHDKVSRPRPNAQVAVQCIGVCVVPATLTVIYVGQGGTVRYIPNCPPGAACGESSAVHLLDLRRARTLPAFTADARAQHEVPILPRLLEGAQLVRGAPPAQGREARVVHRVNGPPALVVTQSGLAVCVPAANAPAVGIAQATVRAWAACVAFGDECACMNCCACAPSPKRGHVRGSVVWGMCFDSQAQHCQSKHGRLLHGVIMTLSASPLSPVPACPHTRVL